MLIEGIQRPKLPLSRPLRATVKDKWQVPVVGSYKCALPIRDNLSASSEIMQLTALRTLHYPLMMSW